jgi:hypothetical protein
MSRALLRPRFRVSYLLYEVSLKRSPKTVFLNPGNSFLILLIRFHRQEPKVVVE